MVAVQLVINNAGVYGPKGLTLDSVKSEDMAFTFQTNTIGPLLVVQQLLHNRLIGKPGSIIGNMTSKVGLCIECCLIIRPELRLEYIDVGLFRVYYQLCIIAAQILIAGCSTLPYDDIAMACIKQASTTNMLLLHPYSSAHWPQQP